MSALNIRISNAAITIAHGNQSHQIGRKSPTPFVKGFIVLTLCPPNRSNIASGVGTARHVTKDRAGFPNAAGLTTDMYRSNLLTSPANRNTVRIVSRRRDGITPHGRGSYLGSIINPRVTQRGSASPRGLMIDAPVQARERTAPTSSSPDMLSHRPRFRRYYAASQRTGSFELRRSIEQTR